MGITKRYLSKKLTRKTKSRKNKIRRNGGGKRVKKFYQAK